MAFRRLGLCLLILLTLENCIEIVYGSATISVKFISFLNPNGLGDNGHCCDGRGVVCDDKCDHYFMLCLDNADSDHANSGRVCPLGKKRTGLVWDAHEITFGSRIGGTPNPMLFDVQVWRGSMLMKVDIWDDDKTNIIFGRGDDFVDFVVQTVNIPRARNKNEAMPIRQTISQRVSLVVELKVYCNPNYYGEDCGVFCQARDDELGHYTCEPDTGAITCRSGWMGALCNTEVNECLSVPCQHGGRCEDRMNSFICHCTPGFSGTLCHHNIDDCIEANCTNNATCVDGMDEFKCLCPQGLTGTYCETVVPVKTTSLKPSSYATMKKTIETSIHDMTSNFPGSSKKRGDMYLDHVSAVKQTAEAAGASWIEKNIYLIIIPILVVVLVIVMLFLIFRYKKWKQAKGGPVEVDPEDDVYSTIDENTRRNIVKNLSCTPAFNNQMYTQVATRDKNTGGVAIDAKALQGTTNASSRAIDIPKTSQYTEECIPLAESGQEHEYCIPKNEAESYMVPKACRSEQAPTLPARNDNVYSSPPNNEPVKNKRKHSKNILYSESP